MMQRASKPDTMTKRFFLFLLNLKIWNRKWYIHFIGYIIKYSFLVLYLII